MRVDFLFIQLLVMLLPGLIWEQLVVTYAKKKRPGTSEFLIRAFIFGVLTYSVVYLAYRALGSDFSYPQVGESQLFPVAFIDEILWSSVAAFVFSLAWIYGSTKRWMIRILNWANVSKTHGEQDIWDLSFSSGELENTFVHVRDLDRNLTYAGWVVGYSETETLRELLLMHVQVSGADGNSIDVPMLYLSRPCDDLHVEFPYNEDEDDLNVNEQES